jgi:hypothetical protein
MALVVGNPALYWIYAASSRPSKDVVAYVTLSQDLLSSFALYLRSWGHVDTGLILPPLHPALIALGSLVSDDLTSLARLISRLSLVLAAFPCYWLLRPRAGWAVATVTVLALQFGSTYRTFALSGLSEPTFILVTSCTLLAISRCGRVHRPGLALTVGVLCALAFLTRQIGLVALPFAVVWLALVDRSHRVPSGAIGRRIAWLLLGYSVLVVPYSAMLYAQTGSHPFVQSFRRGEYSVATNDPAVLAEIEEIEAREPTNYVEIYAQRRSMFQLTPDGSEMYHYLSRDRGVGDGPASTPALLALRNLVSPGTLAGNLLKNLQALGDAVGLPFMIFFCATTLSAFLVRHEEWPFWRRGLLAAYVWSNLVAISLVSGLIPRYVTVLFPFVLLHTAGELYALGRILPIERRGATVLLAAFLASGIVSMPRARLSAVALGAFASNPGPKAWPQHPADALGLHVSFQRQLLGRDVAKPLKLRNRISPGEPVFALHPFDAYLVGGIYRVLPNADLERVVEYGRRTGVRWILVTVERYLKKEVALYTEAPWYENRQLEVDHPDLVERCCGWEPDSARDSRRAVLYRILPRR